MSTPISFTIYGGDYEHTLGVAGLWGDVRLDYETRRVQEIFFGMLEARRFEVCEFSLANYLTLRGRGEDWLTAIPIFPHRAFRHSIAITRRDSKLARLKDLSGCRVGVEDYSMTGAVWFRGLLHDEYGIDARAITWVTPARQRFPFPRNANVETAPRDLETLLCDGEIDAMLGFAMRDARLPPGERRLRPLLADGPAEERSYYERTSIYPINHCVVIRSDVLAKHPGLPAAVCEAYASAKAKAYERQLGTTLVPWSKAHWTSAFELFGGDPLPYGLTPVNRRVVERLAQYLEQQSFIEGAPKVQDLFAV